MKPGRELDLIVAEKLMGGKKQVFNGMAYIYEPETLKCISSEILYRDATPNYSTSMVAAWEIVTTMKQNQLDSSFQLWQDYEGLWHAQFNNKEAEHNADSAPHAICLAALKAFK